MTTRRNPVGLLRVRVDGSLVDSHRRLAALDGRLLVTTAQRAKQPRLWQYALVGGGADVRLAGEGLILRGLCGCFVFGAFVVFRRGCRLRSERRVDPRTPVNAVEGTEMWSA